MNPKWILLAVVASFASLSVGSIVSVSFEVTSCPDPEAIAPCLCTVNDDHGLDLNCSLVENEEQLAQVFRAEMPSNQFTSFKMMDNSNVKVLRDGVFGAATFQNIIITESSLVEVEEKALAGSYATVNTIELKHNKLTTFPFSQLPSFTVLTRLDLTSNEFDQLPLLRSDTLSFLSMADNPLGELPVTAIQELPNLEVCHLYDTQLTSISPGTFMGHRSLRTIYLSNNSIEHLAQGTFEVAMGGFIMLGFNNMTNVEVGAITGLAGEWLFLYYNSLTTLDEAIYRPLMDQFSHVRLYDNPLACGCDMAWLITNPAYMSKLGGLAACDDGTLLIALDPAKYEDCPRLATPPPSDHAPSPWQPKTWLDMLRQIFNDVVKKII